MKWLMLMMIALSVGAQERAMLGVAMALPDYAEFARNYPDVHPLLGVYVESVIEGTSAAEAGLKGGDFLLALDDRPMSLQSEVFRFVSTRKPGDVVRIRYFRPDAVSGDGYGEREVTLSGWQGTQAPRQWFPVAEFIARMRLLRQARAEGWDGWDRQLATYKRDFSWLAAEGLQQSRRAIECMHDMGIYVKGHESMIRRLQDGGIQWPEYALVVAVTRADKGDLAGAEALAKSHVLPQMTTISAARRDFLRAACAMFATPERIRLMRSNPAAREVRNLMRYLEDAAPPPRPGETAAKPPNCGWLAGFLDLDDINSVLWRMHTENRYVNGFEDMRTRLEKEAGSPHMQDTIAWAYADQGEVTRAIEIYKTRVLPFTSDRRYAASLRALEGLLK